MAVAPDARFVGGTTATPTASAISAAASDAGKNMPATAAAPAARVARATESCNLL
jgi:hypothetical protein